MHELKVGDLVRRGDVILPAPDANGSPYANFTFSVQDSAGAFDIAPNTLTLNVTPVNDAPLLDLDANDSSAIGADYATAYTENGTAVSVGDLDLRITDVDHTTLQGASIVLVNARAGDMLVVVGSLPPGVVATINGANSITLSGSASLASYEAAVRAIGFLSLSDSPDTAPRTVQVSASDGTASSNVATTTINVLAVNDVPVNTAPGSQALNEDQAGHVFGSAGGNRIVVADVDGDTLTTTVSVTRGILIAVAFAGATITNNGSASVTITGTAAAINGALDGLAYTPTADYNGADSLSIATSDGTATDTDTVAITLAAVADIAADTAITTEDAAVTINVLANDTFENPDRTITHVNGAAVTPGGAAVAVANGSVALDAASQLIFTPVANYSGAANFNYTVTSGGVTETAGVSVTVNPVNDAPVINASSATVSEEGLSRGLADTVGSPDTSNARTFSGTMAVSDVDSSPTVTFAAPAPGALTSAGQTVTWSGTGTNLLVGSSAAGEVLRIAIDNTGAYTVTLSRPVDHAAGGGENLRSLSFGVNASDGIVTTSSTLTVGIEDDSPVASTISQTLPMTPEQPDVNLMIILDKSSSMDGIYNGGPSTRMELAQAAIKALLDNYANYGGTVRVKIVSFGNFATEEGGDGSAWVGIAAAKILVDGVVPVAPAGGTTYYDDGIAKAQTAYLSPGKITGAASVSYFISDGDPSPGHAIDTEEAGWRTFLEANGIRSLAFGVIENTEGADLQSVAEVAAGLNPVAYDGATRTDLNATPITSFADMTHQLIPGPFGTAHGSLVAVPNTGAGATVQGFGADGGYVQSLTVEGTTYSYNPASGGTISVTGTNHGSFNSGTDVLTITIAAGANAGDRLLMNMDTGFYEYNIHAPTAAPVTQGFSYTLTDLDGDTSSSSASITLSPLVALNENAAAPVIGNVLSTTVDEQGDVLSVTDVVMNGVTLAPGVSVAGVYGTLVVNADGTYSYAVNSAQANTNGLFAGQLGIDVFTTHVSDGQGNTSTSDLVIQVTGTAETGTTVNGTNGNNTLNGTSGTDLLNGLAGTDTLNGVDGNDRLDGGNGNDTLNGGNGNDLLIGGAGNDNLTGGAGADVFQWRLNDNGTTGTPAADIITDFNVASRASGGDVLDLRDMLVGEYHVGTDAGNLANYLHFERSGNNTVLYVSTTGAFASGFNANNDNQNITLQNVNLISSMTSDSQVIEDLFKRGKLIADAG